MRTVNLAIARLPYCFWYLQHVPFISILSFESISTTILTLWKANLALITVRLTLFKCQCNLFNIHSSQVVLWDLNSQWYLTYISYTSLLTLGIQSKFDTPNCYYKIEFWHFFHYYLSFIWHPGNNFKYFMQKLTLEFVVQKNVVDPTLMWIWQLRSSSFTILNCQYNPRGKTNLYTYIQALKMTYLFWHFNQEKLSVWQFYNC